MYLSLAEMAEMAEMAKILLLDSAVALLVPVRIMDCE